MHLGKKNAKYRTVSQPLNGLRQHTRTRTSAAKLGLAVIGSVAWTVVNRHVKDSLSHAAAGHNLARHAAAAPGGPIYDHALASGVTTALTMGAGATVLALIVTLIAIRVRREDLPDSPLVM